MTQHILETLQHIIEIWGPIYLTAMFFIYLTGVVLTVVGTFVSLIWLALQSDNTDYEKKATRKHYCIG